MSAGAGEQPTASPPLGSSRGAEGVPLLPLDPHIPREDRQTLDALGSEDGLLPRVEKAHGDRPATDSGSKERYHRARRKLELS